MIPKYRAKRIDNGQFVYGCLIYNLDPCIETDTIKQAFIREPLANLANFIEVEPKTICQYIGLNDKNKTEIYDHDTLNVDCSGVGGCFNDGVYKVAYFLPDCAFCLVQIDGQHAINFNECYEYEVIKNPELC